MRMLATKCKMCPFNHVHSAILSFKKEVTEHTANRFERLVFEAMGHTQLYVPQVKNERILATSKQLQSIASTITSIHFVRSIVPHVMNQSNVSDYPSSSLEDAQFLAKLFRRSMV